MSIAADLKKRIDAVFASAWEEIKTTSIPDPTDVALNANKAKLLESATVLYADLDGSTNMVDQRTWSFAAEVYKTFLLSAGEIIRAESGVVTAYDGDRVMGIFVGEENKNTRAVRAAFKIRTAVTALIEPALRAIYTSSPKYSVKFRVGIDTSPIRVTRTGVWGDNDLVWVGRAPNYAAKLTDLSIDYTTIITAAVHERLNASLKNLDTAGKPVWAPFTWNAMKGMKIYASTCHWTAL